MVHFSFDVISYYMSYYKVAAWRVAQRCANRSQVVVFLLNVSVCVLKTQRLDVMGDVRDAPVEFLRA